MICRKCQCDKPAEAFQPQRRICRQCRVEINHQWRKSHAPPPPPAPMPTKCCKTCERTLSVSLFHRYESGHYREHCINCWSIVRESAKVQKYRTKPRTKLGKLGLPKVITDELRAAVKLHYPSGGLKAVKALFPDARDSNIRRAAMEMGVHVIRKVTPPAPTLSDLETVAREAMELRQFEVLQVWYSHSGRVTTTPMGRRLTLIERGKSTLNIGAIKAQIVNARVELQAADRERLREMAA